MNIVLINFGVLTNLIFYSWLVMKAIDCQRRIVGGKAIQIERRYMVYIIRRNETPVEDHICGGAIISKRAVITFFPCLAPHKMEYVVAGYKKYEPVYENDKCIKTLARRVTRHFYTGLGENQTTWQNQGIAIVEVSPAFNFADERYLLYCSYAPTTIRIMHTDDYDDQFHNMYTVLGWGSLKYYRPNGFDINFNEKYLMATTTTIIKSKKCEDEYKEIMPKESNAKKRFFCTEGAILLDVDGNYKWDNRRSNSKTIYQHPGKFIQKLKEKLNNDSLPTRRFGWPKKIVDSGPCYNDQGGPIVGWIGGIEYIRGIMNSFLVDDEMKCTGPFLHCDITKYTLLISCALRTIRVDIGEIKYTDWPKEIDCSKEVLVREA